jgi:hypothetical protein
MLRDREKVYNRGHPPAAPKPGGEGPTSAMGHAHTFARRKAIREDNQSSSTYVWRGVRVLDKVHGLAASTCSSKIWRALQPEKSLQELKSQ